MTAWRGQMTAAQSRLYAEHVVIPSILPKIGLDGRIEAVELDNDQIARTLDIVGGIDYWVRTSDNRLITIASRNQWYYDDGVNRDSFTIRVDIGGPRTEAHKRVLAIKNGGMVPDWTVQGYITPDHCLHHAGAIPTRDLFDAFLEAAHDPKFTTKFNHADGHEFWAGYWATLRKYGHARRLFTVSAELFSAYEQDECSHNHESCEFGFGLVCLKGDECRNPHHDRRPYKSQLLIGADEDLHPSVRRTQ